MSVEVHPVRSASEMRTFIILPWTIYRDDPNWVAPLVNDQKTLMSRTKNPFFEHAEAQYFLACRDGEPVGRIAAIHDRNYIDFHDEPVGFFGFFESIHDQAVANALIAAAGQWVAARGLPAMYGPTNPGTNDVLGTLIDAFDRPPMVMMPYNPRWYPALLEGAGLSKAKDLLAYWLDEDHMRIDRLERTVTLLKKRYNLRLRPINLKRLDEEIALIKEIYNDAWERNWGFVPWTDAEIEHLGHELKPVADPELVMFAYQNETPVGFSLTLPDVHQALIHLRSGRLLPFGIFTLLRHQKQINQVRVLAMGIRHAYRGMGVDALFYHRTFRYAETRGMQRGECSWILEDNQPMRAAMEKMGGTVYKTYRVYQKQVRG